MDDDIDDREFDIEMAALEKRGVFLKRAMLALITLMILTVLIGFPWAIWMDRQGRLACERELAERGAKRLAIRGAECVGLLPDGRLIVPD